MPIGTVHSICRRILSDRRFSRGSKCRSRAGVCSDPLPSCDVHCRVATHGSLACRICSTSEPTRTVQGGHHPVAAVVRTASWTSVSRRTSETKSDFPGEPPRQLGERVGGLA
jgi:hypothetical protein